MAESQLITDKRCFSLFGGIGGKRENDPQYKNLFPTFPTSYERSFCSTHELFTTIAYRLFQSQYILIQILRKHLMRHIANSHFIHN